MRKSAILLSILLAASVATAADAKRKKMAPAPKPVVAYTNEQSASLIGTAVGNWMPWGTMQAAPAPAKKMAHHKKKMKKKA